MLCAAFIVEKRHFNQSHFQQGENEVLHFVKAMITF